MVQGLNDISAYFCYIPLGFDMPGCTGKNGRAQQCEQPNAINLPFGDGLYHKSMMILGMVYGIGYHKLDLGGSSMVSSRRWSTQPPDRLDIAQKVRERGRI